ncbi:MAG: lysophospholipid acyltransferase family protein [Casimicrobiaceae bacterium]
MTGRETTAADRNRPPRRLRTALPVRVLRIARAGVHLVQGLATIAIVFPRVAAATRQRLVQAWSARLLDIFSLDLRVAGELTSRRERGLMIAANHVSWLDIFVINAVAPARFIAKHELAHWPVAGRLISGVGTLYIDRMSRRHLHEANAVVGASLAAGDTVAMFPEGRIGDGSDVLHFHGSLLQPVVAQGAPLQPMAICYRSRDGRGTSAPVWLDGLSFLGSVWRVTSLQTTRVDVTILAALAGEGGQRRALAQAAETSIRQAVSALPGGSGPGPRDDRGAASP